MTLGIDLPPDLFLAGRDSRRPRVALPILRVALARPEEMDRCRLRGLATVVAAVQILWRFPCSRALERSGFLRRERVGDEGKRGFHPALDGACVSLYIY